MAQDGTLQFVHAAIANANDKPSFSPPARTFQARAATVVSTGRICEAKQLVEKGWTLLTDVLTAHIMEDLGLKGSAPLISCSQSMRKSAHSISTFWSRVTFTEDRLSDDNSMVMSKRLTDRFRRFASVHSSRVSALGLRNTPLSSSLAACGEPLLKKDVLADEKLWGSFRALRRLVLHSFSSVELHILFKQAWLMQSLHRLDLLQCCGISEQTFLLLQDFPVLKGLGIWGLKSTIVSPPSRWPARLMSKLQELSLDPVDMSVGVWPCFGDNFENPQIQRLHMLTAKPNLPVSVLPTSLRCLSLATVAQDISNPFVAAFLLTDAHVQIISSSLCSLEDVVLRGHPALSSGSIESLALIKALKRLSLCSCSGMDSAEAHKIFEASQWPALEAFEAPGPKFFNHQSLTHLNMDCICIVEGQTASGMKTTLVPNAGELLEHRSPDEFSLSKWSPEPARGSRWWDGLLADQRSPACGWSVTENSTGHVARNSPLGKLATFGHFLHSPGDFGLV